MKRIAKLWIMLAAALLLLTGAVLAAEDAPDADAGIVDPYRLYPYEQLTADLAALEARYPELISVSSIGQSVEGREIPVFRLGRGAREILVCAAMHAREYETTNYIMYVAEQYCRAYEADEWYYGLSYRKMLDGVCFVIVPQLNPDGVVIAQQGTPYAAGRPDLLELPITDGWPGNYYCWKANARGVDLNRNWPYAWNTTVISKRPSSAGYAGPEAASEPETQAMLALIEQTPFYAFCSFHSAGNCIYWSDSSNSRDLLVRLSPVVQRIADFIGYPMMSGDKNDRYGGCMINYARAVYEKPCFTVEIGPYVGRYPYPDYEKLRPIIERAYPICLLLADEVLKMPEEASRGVSVTLDGSAVQFPDVHPLIENGRVLTPVRAVCEAAGIGVAWDDGVVTLSGGGSVVTLQIGSAEIDVNGSAVQLDCAPKITDGRTLVPIRAVMEAFGCTVDWDGPARTVIVRTSDLTS